MQCARLRTANIAEYLIPISADIGELRSEMLEEQNANFNPLWADGIVGTTSATDTAIYRGSGKCVTSLQMHIVAMMPSRKPCMYLRSCPYRM